MSTDFKEEAKISGEENGGESEYVYKNVIKNKEQRRTWSVISLGLAILSIFLSYFSWVGLVLGLASIGAGIISRKNLGYFDKLSLVGLIVAIFGVVFSITGIAFGAFFDTLIG
jgi:predicted exporter